jgi:hypothetical protein
LERLGRRLYAVPLPFDILAMTIKTIWTFDSAYDEQTPGQH